MACIYIQNFLEESEAKPKIKCLNLDYTESTPGETSSQLSRIIPYCEELRILHLTGCYDQLPYLAAALSALPEGSYSNIEKLDLFFSPYRQSSQNSTVDSSQINHILMRCPKLRFLNLLGSVGVIAPLITALGNLSPEIVLRLEELDLRCTGATAEEQIRIKELLPYCSKILF